MTSSPFRPSRAFIQRYRCASHAGGGNRPDGKNFGRRRGVRISRGNWNRCNVPNGSVQKLWKNCAREGSSTTIKHFSIYSLLVRPKDVRK